MSIKSAGLIILLLLIGCQQVGVATEALGIAPEVSADAAELDVQLKINREALLKGSSDQIRIDAATVLLYSEDKMARKILLNALSLPDNTAAQIAICTALSQARNAEEPVTAKQDFIAPLIAILTSDETGDIAKPAADATLLFKYEQVSNQLEEKASDESLNAWARANAIYALKLQPDKRAILKLMELLDDTDKQVSLASAEALTSLNIPIGTDAASRWQIKSDFLRMDRAEFLRVWEIRQHQAKQIQLLREQLQLWQEMYQAALDVIYSGKEGEADKGKFLAESLANSESTVRLWALEKVHQWRTGTSPKLPAELGPVLLNLIADPDADVRLKTANVLSLMGELNSAQKLLTQIETEQDDQIRTELFVALGAACNYALLPNAEFKISAEIRKQTLELAVEYLFEQDAVKVQKGAEVLKRLLEQNSLTSAEVNKYIGALSQRYAQLDIQGDGMLRGELLSAMAGLCGQSVYSTEAAKMFRPLFEQVLHDETNLVREAAVDGLIYIDKARALEILKRDSLNDSSAVVQEKLIILAGEVGGKDDMGWLFERIGTTAQSELVWQAMLKIFKRDETKADLLKEWMPKLYAQNGKLSKEQLASFLEIAERKAQSESDAGMLRDVREHLADLYTGNGDFERAAEYLGLLRESAETAEEKQAILGRLLDVYLQAGSLESAGQLVTNSLLEKDLEPNSVLVSSIENYLSHPPEGADIDAVLKMLGAIETADRPLWDMQLKVWLKKAEKAQEPNKPA
ncbi:MAG: hypothetical protein FVQ80_03115 [Planctomycetes bacterium]|nr:hypothetical protein [Planctomycetota bacterium]